MFRNQSLILMVLISVFCLFSCGSGNSDSENPDNDQNNSYDLKIVLTYATCFANSSKIDTVDRMTLEVRDDKGNSYFSNTSTEDGNGVKVILVKDSKSSNYMALVNYIDSCCVLSQNTTVPVCTDSISPADIRIDVFAKDENDQDVSVVEPYLSSIEQQEQVTYTFSYAE